jgi:hypothetical protein
LIGDEICYLRLGWVENKCPVKDDTSVFLTQYRVGDKIEKIEMGGACSTYGGRQRCTGFWWGNLRERDPWGDPGVDARKILQWIFNKWEVGVRTGLGWLRTGTGGGRV